jgi:hypothetical protein
MNHPNPPDSKATSASTGRLLDSIRAVQNRVGDGLNDDELTRLIQKETLPAESGFAFLSYSERFATLSVPGQNLAAWYPGPDWIAPKKEKLARSIAQKYGLSICEPPDAKYLMTDAVNRHHHLELGDAWETVIMIHPEYLKVRLSGATTVSASAEGALRPLFQDTDLLQELSAFYQA